MSAPSGSVAWNLRCLVRERLIAFVQQNYPESLPKNRTEIANLGRKREPSQKGGTKVRGQ